MLFIIGLLKTIKQQRKRLLRELNDNMYKQDFLILPNISLSTKFHNLLQIPQTLPQKPIKFKSFPLKTVQKPANFPRILTKNLLQNHQKLPTKQLNLKQLRSLRISIQSIKLLLKSLQNKLFSHPKTVPQNRLNLFNFLLFSLQILNPYPTNIS